MSAGVTRGLLQIGEVAERTGLSLRTVRHYEEVGLLPAAERSPGGFRLYTEVAVQRLLVIKKMKPCELTLDQMREVLEALDVLDERSADGGGRAAALTTIAGHQQAVGEAVVRLRQRLANAEGFAAVLTDRLTTG